MENADFQLEVYVSTKKSIGRQIFHLKPQDRLKVIFMHCIILCILSSGNLSVSTGSPAWEQKSTSFSPQMTGNKYKLRQRKLGGEGNRRDL